MHPFIEEITWTPAETCPECGAKESCYACVTSGGWIDPKRAAKQEREQEISP